MCFSKLKVAFYVSIDGAIGIQRTKVDSDGFDFESTVCVQLIGKQTQDGVQ